MYVERNHTSFSLLPNKYFYVLLKNTVFAFVLINEYFYYSKT